MTYWLAEAAKAVRIARGRKLVHIASELSRSESTLSRFERHLNVPDDIDATVAAYARDLGLKPIEIWERALELWREAPEEDEDEVSAAEAGQAVAGVVDRLEERDASRRRQARASRETPGAAARRKRA